MLDTIPCAKARADFEDDPGRAAGTEVSDTNQLAR